MSIKRSGTGRGSYMISAVAAKYNIHPQTLRLYEREGLLKPSRTEGNTRLYSEDDLKELETILALTRDLGVNLAGVEIILNMRAKMEAMQEQMEELFSTLNDLARRARPVEEESRNSLIPVLRVSQFPSQKPQPRASRAGRGARSGE